jgi:hypothetical protein
MWCHEGNINTHNKNLTHYNRRMEGEGYVKQSKTQNTVSSSDERRIDGQLSIFRISFRKISQKDIHLNAQIRKQP